MMQQAKCKYPTCPNLANPPYPFCSKKCGTRWTWLKDPNTCPRCNLCSLSTKAKGGFVLLMQCNYYGKRDPSVVLGLERGGNYKNEWNVPGGKIDVAKNECSGCGAKRELLEEAKVRLAAKPTLVGDPIWIGDATIIFVVRVSDGFSLVTPNQTIETAMKTPNIPWDQQEMAAVSRFNLNSGLIFNPKPPATYYANNNISSFARAIMNRIQNGVFPICGQCGYESPPSQCSGCNRVAYCDRHCQLKHWDVHAEICAQLK